MNNKLQLPTERLRMEADSRHTAPQKYFAAEVVFGSPQKNCAGSGICKVLSPVTHHSAGAGCLNCRRAHALISTRPSATHLFRFVRQSMSAELIQEHFGSGFFLVESAFHFRLPTWQHSERISIAPGAYPVTPGPDFLSVWFKNEMAQQNR